MAIQYGSSSYKYGNNTRKYGLSTSGTLHGGTVSSNQLQILPSGSTPSIIVSITSYTDFTFSTQIKLGGTGGIIFWQQGQGSNSYYLIQFTAGSNVAYLYLSQNGVVSTLSVTHLTQFPSNSYTPIEVHAQSGWISVVVNGQTILTAYDTTYTSGNIGFYALNDMWVQNVQMPTFYEDIPSFIINSGDSISDSLTSLAGIKAGYVRINSQGQTTATIPQSTDQSVYTYQNEIVSHSHVQSDVEPYDYIIVYGSNNAMGVAYSQSQINAHNGDMRVKTITDETLITNNQCITKAQRELALSQRHLHQPEIDVSLNCGLELFDVVTVVNTAQGVNGNYRVMNIKTNLDIEQANYTQVLDLSLP